MKNKKIIYFLITLICFFIEIQTSMADEASLEFIGKIGSSVKNMELIIDDGTFNAQFTTLDISLTTAYNKLYLTLSHERSIQDDIISALDSNGNPGLLFLSRQDNALTAGYNLWRNTSLFGGFRQGKTESHFNLSNQKLNVKSDGIFGGISYNHSVDNNNTIGLSIAAAQLSGEATLAEPFTVRPNVPAVPENIDGDALGYSFSINWLSALSSTTNFNAGFKVQRYEFEDQVIFGGIDLSYEENYTSFSFGISRYF